MKHSEIAKLITATAAIDHRVPPLAPDRPDERVPVWAKILDGLDYQTCDQALLEIARDPQMIQIRPGDIYQGAKRIMRHNLRLVEVASIEPPDNATGAHYIEWKRALIRSLGRGTPPAEAQAEADRAVGATRKYPSLADQQRLQITKRPQGRFFRATHTIPPPRA